MIGRYRTFIPTHVLILLVTEILLLAACYAAPLIWQLEAPLLFFLYEEGSIQLAMAVAPIILGLYLSNCYSQIAQRTWIQFFQQLCLIVGYSFLWQAILAYLSAYTQTRWQMSWQYMVTGSLLCLAILPSWRMAYSRLVLNILGAERLLLIGDHPLQWQLADQISAHSEMGLQVVGYVAEEKNPTTAFSYLGTIGEVENLSPAVKPHRLILAPDIYRQPSVVLQLVHLQQSARIRVESATVLHESVFGRLAGDEIYPDLLFSPVVSHAILLEMLLARIMALATLILLLPVLAVKTLWLKRSGAVFVRRLCMGWKGEPFVLLEFRQGYLRRLPTLWNVCMGEMCLIGPRPMRYEFHHTLDNLIPFHALRWSLRPGILGWEQIQQNDKNGATDAILQLEYDLYYLKNASPWLDVYIFLHTFRKALFS